MCRVKHLKDDVAAFDKRQKGHPFTRLVWPLRGEDPDDAFSGIPYEKGFNLLHYLETLVGTETFESFAKAYIQTFKFGTVTAGEFKDFFIRYIKETSVEAAVKIEKLDWEELLHAPGLPSYLPDFSENNALLDDVKGLSKKWLGFFNDRAQPSGVAASDIEGWSTLQKIIFLESFLDYCDEQRKLSVTFLESLDKIYSFTSYGNAEIKFRWQSLCLRCNVPWIGPHVVAFLTSQGRMKFVRPLYRALFASSFGRELALDTFDAHCDKYHPIAKKMVDADFDKTMTSYEKRKRKKL
jgi:leukotriene-A4 hydrolase